MSKILSLLLIPIFAFIFFFVAYTPVEAACSYVSSTTFIQPNSSFDITVTAISGSFVTVSINDGHGNISPLGGGQVESGESSVTISVTSPPTTGSYLISVERTIIAGGSEDCDPLVTTLDVALDAPTVDDPNAPAELGAIVTVIKNIIKLLVPAAAVAFFIMLIIGGGQFIFSGGDPKAAAGARNTLTYAIIGIILVIVSWLILLVVQNVTGVDVTNVLIPGLSP